MAFRALCVQDSGPGIWAPKIEGRCPGLGPIEAWILCKPSGLLRSMPPAVEDNV